MECRGSRMGERVIDDCVPFDYDPSGWPLGIMCAGAGCGAWICSKPTHSIKFVVKKKKVFFCRTCVAEKNLPKKLLDSLS